MSEADELLRSGDLDGARRVLVEGVRRTPGDVPARLFLFQLLALAGEWDKAGTQLSTLAQLSPEAQMLSVVYRQAMDAERERDKVWAGESLAPIHGGSAWAGGVAEAIRLGATGRTGEAESLREQAFADAPDTPGTLNDTNFDWIADADPRFGPTVEAIVGGRYGLLPFEAIESLDSEGPRDLRDLVWFPVELTLKAGARIAALLPARYPGLGASPDERLARATDWREDGSGVGQHLWTTSAGDDHGLLSVRTLRFG